MVKGIREVLKMTGSSYRLIVEIAERYAKLAEKKAAARATQQVQVQVAPVQKQPEPTQSFGDFGAEYGMWFK